jgi:hypothetical protein
MGVGRWRRGTEQDQEQDQEQEGSAAATLPQVAVLTVARDEAVMLPRWIRHYGDQVGVENLIVFDDNSSDGSTDDLPCTVHRIPGFPPAKFEGHRVRLVSGVARGLLETYDWVVFTDVDEFLLADPAQYSGLRDLLAHRPQARALASMALQVLHHVDVEPPLDLQAPVLDQRVLGSFAPVMCKPAVKRVGAPWTAASHGLRAEYAVDPALFMVHLKFADRDLLRAVADRRNAMVAQDQRGMNTTWSRTGEDVVGVLERLVRGVEPASVPEFDPRSIKLGELVHRDGKAWRSTRHGQIAGLEKHGVVRLPERLRGLV